jgi:hypothetical protein
MISSYAFGMERWWWDGGEMVVRWWWGGGVVVRGGAWHYRRSRMLLQLPRIVDPRIVAWAGRWTVNINGNILLDM